MWWNGGSETSCKTARMIKKCDYFSGIMLLLAAEQPEDKLLYQPNNA